MRSSTPRNKHEDSKLASIVFTKELHRRLHDRDTSAAAFRPGNVASSFASDTSSLFRLISNPTLQADPRSSDKGAKPLTWLAEGALGSWQSGEYYEKYKLAKTPKPQTQNLPRTYGTASITMAGLPRTT